jgi:hypothetical protein
VDAAERHEAVSETAKNSFTLFVRQRFQWAHSAKSLMFAPIEKAAIGPW